MVVFISAMTIGTRIAYYKQSEQFIDKKKTVMCFNIITFNVMLYHNSKTKNVLNIYNIIFS